MPTGLTDPLTSTDLAEMSVDELCEHHRELLARIRDVDHWQRLIAARLDLAVAAVADLTEPEPAPAALMPAMTAAARAAQNWPRELLAAALGEPVPAEARESRPNGLVAAITTLPAGELAEELGELLEAEIDRPPFALPPDGLRDLLGIARFEERLIETALLPRLRQARAELDVYGEALRAVAGEAAHLIAAASGTTRLPA